MNTKQFIKKRMAAAPKRMAHFGLATAGTVGAAMLSNHDMLRDKVPTKWHGALLFSAGALSNMLNPEEYSNSLLTGVGNYGGLLLAAQVTKKPQAYGVSKSAVGLDGLGNSYSNEVDGKPDWAKLIDDANRAIQDHSTAGLDNLDAGTNTVEELVNSMQISL
jgi:hypothetical protein